MAPIFVPPTPNGELAARLRKIATTEAEAGVNFRIVETGDRREVHEEAVPGVQSHGYSRM